MSIFLIVSMFVLLAMGLPIFVAMCLPSLLSVLIFMDLDLMIISQRMIGGVDKFSLLSVPFFIMGANVMKTAVSAGESLNGPALW